MPAILTEPPERGTYAHVLFRGDRYLQEHAIAVICYTGHFDSRWVKWVGRDPRTDQPAGLPVHMIFVNMPEERDYALQRGWLDITADWFEHLELGAVGEVDIEKVIAALASPSTAASIARVAGISAERVGGVLASLDAAGRVQRRGSGAVVIWSLTPAPVEPAPVVEPAPEGAGAAA